MSSSKAFAGMAVAWVAYSMMFLGYAWLRGYNITLLQVVGPVNYYKGSWPPPLYKGTSVLPDGFTGGEQLGQAVQGAAGAIQQAINNGTLT